MMKEELLLKDLELTQSFVSKIDGFLFWTRNWAIVLCSAVIAFSVTKGFPYLMLFNIPILIGFYFIELIQKCFHEDAMAHARRIEEIIQGTVFGTSPIPKDYQFGLAHAIQVPSRSRMLAIVRNQARWHTAAFYLLILLFTIGALMPAALISETLRSRSDQRPSPVLCQYQNGCPTCREDSDASSLGEGGVERIEKQ